MVCFPLSLKKTQTIYKEYFFKINTQIKKNSALCRKSSCLCLFERSCKYVSFFSFLTLTFSFQKIFFKLVLFLSLFNTYFYCEARFLLSCVRNMIYLLSSWFIRFLTSKLNLIVAKILLMVGL